MFLIGISSLIQCWFLPGFLLSYNLKQINFIDRIILSLPISIVINYILVIFLLNINFFNQLILFFIFTSEIFLLIYFFKRDLFKVPIIKIPRIYLNSLNFLNILLVVIFLYLAIKSFGKIIFPGDPYVMWNRWAIDIFNNKLPIKNLDYPIGYPALQAISYKMIGTYKIEFFAQAVQVIYPLFSLLVLIRIKKITNNDFFSFILLFFSLLVLNQFRHTLYIGFVDTILVFCSTLLIYLIELIRHNKKLFYEINFLIILGIVLSAPGLIKQTGLYISFISPLILFFFLDLKFKIKHLKNILILSLIIFFIVSPWYLYKIFFLINDIGSANAVNLISLQEEKTLIEKIVRTSKLIFGLGIYLIIPMFLISLYKKDSRNFLALIILPYYFIWSFLYGNDARNFALILPFVAFVLADSIFTIDNYLIKKINKSLKKFIPIIIVISLLLFLNEKRNYDYMFNKNQIQTQNRTLHKEVNILINHYKKKIIKNNKIYFSDSSFLNLPNFLDSEFLTCNLRTSNFLKDKKEKKFYLYKINQCSKNFIESEFIKKDSIIIFKEHGFVLITNY